MDRWDLLSVAGLLASICAFVLSGKQRRAGQDKARAPYRSVQDECKTPETQHLMRC